MSMLHSFNMFVQNFDQYFERSSEGLWAPNLGVCFSEGLWAPNLGGSSFEGALGPEPWRSSFGGAVAPGLSSQNLKMNM